MKKQKRDNKGRFRRAVSKMSLFTLITLLLVSAYGAGVKSHTNTVQFVKAQEVDNLTPKIEKLKGEVLDTIRDCERAGHTEDDGLITFDPHKTNKKVEIPSIGEYQFKVPTVQYYYKALYGKDITRKEAVLIALDSTKARELASSVIFDSKSGTGDWINCGENNKDVQRKLLVIKELQK